MMLLGTVMLLGSRERVLCVTDVISASRTPDEASVGASEQGHQGCLDFSLTVRGSERIEAPLD